MTISTKQFQRLQSGVKSADDKRVLNPINAMMAWLGEGLPGELNTHFGEVSNSISVAIQAFSNSVSIQVANQISVYASTRAAFLAHKNGTDQLSISNAVIAVTFGTESFDVGSFFASNAWTPRAGKVRITVNIEWSSLNAVDNELLEIFLLKNAGFFRNGVVTRAGTNFCTQAVTTLDDANGTDFYSVSVRKASGSAGAIVGASTGTWFCGEAVS